jgi:hypothetical protein
MKRNRVVVVLVVVMLCVVLAGTAGAQANKPDAPDAAVGTAFTYQGQIKRNGALFTGTCDLQFKLWDASSAGTQQGSTLNVNAVSVTGGVFTVGLDFGNQFKGDARWLETAAKCADDAGFTTLPRVALNPAPYAVGLMPGAQTLGNISGSAGIYRAVNLGPGAALVGLANSATGTTYGVLGNAFSPNGYAVLGYADGGATGVQGWSDSSGVGVWGRSATGAGVFGESALFEGVRGLAHDVNHGAVVGIHDGGGFGVFGNSPSGAGVVGTSTSWVGVYGESTASSGVWGKSANGAGVVGESGAWVGVYGVSTNNAGVWGKSTNGFAGYFEGKVGITGGSDLAERFATADNARIEPGTVMVIDEDHAGKLKVSDRAYDSKVIGIISGAGGINTGLILHQDGALEGDLIVAIAGRVYCQSEAHSAPIKPGDMLTTSSVKGYCMKATDRDQAYGAVIGKALTGLDKGEGLVLVIVNLQ